MKRMSGVQGVADAAVVQDHVLSLHAFTVPASPQGLIESFELKATLAIGQDPTSYPAAFTGAGLLSSHSCVVHHVVDGAKEWRNLKEGTAQEPFKLQICVFFLFFEICLLLSVIS